MSTDRYIYPSPDEPEWPYWIIQTVLAIILLLIIFH